MEKEKCYFISIKETTVFIAAKGNKLTFHLILLPADLHYTQKVVLLFSFRKSRNKIPNKYIPNDQILMIMCL